jgi:hypothetical protein
MTDRSLDELGPVDVQGIIAAVEADAALVAEGA